MKNQKRQKSLFEKATNTNSQLSSRPHTRTSINYPQSTSSNQTSFKLDSNWFASNTKPSTIIPQPRSQLKQHFTNELPNQEQRTSQLEVDKFQIERRGSLIEKIKQKSLISNGQEIKRSHTPKIATNTYPDLGERRIDTGVKQLNSEMYIEDGCNQSQKLLASNSSQNSWGTYTRLSMRGQDRKCSQNHFIYKFLKQDAHSEVKLNQQLRLARQNQYLIKSKKINEIKEKNKQEYEKELIEDPNNYCFAIVKLNENLLSHFDVRKKRYDTSALVQRQLLEEIWGQKLEDILMDEKQLDPVENPIMKEVRTTIEARTKICSMNKRQIKETNLPLELLYNDKIERIRATEESQHKAPQPIRFQILESYQNKPDFRHIKLDCDSVPQTLQFEIDLKHEVVLVEGEAEKFNRRQQWKISQAEKMQKTNFASTYQRTIALSSFMKKLKNQLQGQRDIGKYLRMNENENSEELQRSRFNKEIISLRKGASFDFSKINKPIILPFQDQNLKQTFEQTCNLIEIEQKQKQSYDSRKEVLKNRKKYKIQDIFAITNTAISPLKFGLFNEAPVNKRLVALTRDFLEAAKEFDDEDIVCLQSIQPLVNQGMSQLKASRLFEVIAHLSQKYQLEIVKPNLSFILSQKVAPIDRQNNNHKFSQRNQFAKQPLIKYKYNSTGCLTDDTQPSLKNFNNQVKNQSLMGRWVAESQIISEANFDREEVRSIVVPERSMFKNKNQFYRVFQDKETLYNKLVGNPDTLNDTQ